MRDFFTRKNGSEIIFIEVDMEAEELKSKYPWLFSVFIKFDTMDKNSQNYEEFLELKESLIIALEYDGNVKYVGSRVLDGWSEFYFYSINSKELNSLAVAILKDSNYLNESNVVKDTKWDFFFKHLLPTQDEYHHIQSSKIIFLLEEEGDKLNEVREVEHYVSFTTPTQKNRFLDNLTLDGFSFKDEVSSEEFENGIALVKQHCIEEEVVKEVVDSLLLEIKKENGYYEGWSTTIVEE